jgi:hypothetical protein
MVLRIPQQVFFNGHYAHIDLHEQCVNMRPPHSKDGVAQKVILPNDGLRLNLSHYTTLPDAFIPLVHESPHIVIIDHFDSTQNPFQLSNATSFHPPLSVCPLEEPTNSYLFPSVYI